MKRLSNGIAALVLLAIGLLGLIVDENATMLAIVAVPVLVLMLSKHDYLRIQYGDPRSRK